MAIAKCFIYQFSSTCLKVNYWRSLKFNFKWPCIKNKYKKQWKCVCYWWYLITADIDCGFLFCRFLFLLLFPLGHFRTMGMFSMWCFLREMEAEPKRTMVMCWGNTWQVQGCRTQMQPPQPGSVKQCKTGKQQLWGGQRDNQDRHRFLFSTWTMSITIPTSWDKALEVLQGMCCCFHLKLWVQLEWARWRQKVLKHVIVLHNSNNKKVPVSCKDCIASALIETEKYCICLASCRFLHTEHSKEVSFEESLSTQTSVFHKLQNCKSCSSFAIFMISLLNILASSSDGNRFSFRGWATAQKKVKMFWPLKFDISHCLDEMSEIIRIICNPSRTIFVKPFWHAVCYWSSNFFGTISTSLSIFISPRLGSSSHKYGKYMSIP